MTGLREVDAASLARAYAAGASYWQRNKPYDASSENLAQVARSCGWHGDDTAAWLAGYWHAFDQGAGQ